MTVIDCGGVHVVFEGAHRLRWSREPVWTKDPDDIEGPWFEGRLIGHVWPERHYHPRIQRQIEHGQRTIVVLDGKAPILTLPRKSVPSVPVGAEVLAEDGDYRTILIPPLNWLSSHHRTRGSAFMADAKRKADGMLLPLVEADLIGTREPLRFVTAMKALALGEIQDLISELYQPAAPTIDFALTNARAPKVLRASALDTRDAA